MSEGGHIINISLSHHRSFDIQRHLWKGGRELRRNKSSVRVCLVHCFSAQGDFFFPTSGESWSLLWTITAETKRFYKADDASSVYQQLYLWSLQISRPTPPPPPPPPSVSQFCVPEGWQTHCTCLYMGAYATFVSRNFSSKVRDPSWLASSFSTSYTRRDIKKVTLGFFVTLGSKSPPQILAGRGRMSDTAGEDILYRPWGVFNSRNKVHKGVFYVTISRAL